MTQTDILELFRRLKPQYGPKIDRLWLAYSLSDRKEREAIEEILHMMEATSLRKTPDDKTVNLPPPPQDIAQGKFHLGTVLFNGKPLHDFSLPDTATLRQHIAIFGRSGAGKTNLLYHLLDSFQAEKIPFWIFDWKRDYRALLKRKSKGEPLIFTVGRPLAPLRFNPLFPPTGSEKEIAAYHERLVDVIGRTFYVGHGVKSLLRKGLKAITSKWRENPQENPLDFKVLLHWIEEYRPKQNTKGRRSGDWAESTIRALESLCLGHFGSGLNTQEGVDLAALMNQNVIFELDALADDQKSFFVESLLLWLRQRLLNRSEDDDKEELKLALVIEEAHHVLKTGREEGATESVLETTLRETRSLGMGLVLVDQTPSLINRVAFSNTFTSVFFSLKGRQDIHAAAGALLLARDQEEYLGRLPVGTAIVKLQDKWFDPFLIRVPHIKDKDLPVKDEDVKRHFQAVQGRFGRLSGPSSSFQPAEEESEPDEPAENPEREEESPVLPIDLTFLKGILEDPLIGINQRYKRLGVSTRHGNESKDRLIQAGFVRAVNVPTPTARLKLLELTAAGDRYCRQHKLATGPKLRNGAEHKYWKQKVAEHFKNKGYRVTIEKSVVNGKRVDVEAVRGEERFAIEVETSHANSTSDFDLVLKYYPRLIVLATDINALAKVTAAVNQLPEADRKHVACWLPADIEGATKAAH